MKDWIKKSIVYQIYPRSFCDSNHDGIGDLQGIISKLDYLSHLGVNVIWLSPVYQSPNDDNGYDISDYKSINQEYGSMADMDELIKEAKKRHIRILMDLVINHTSDEHEWFIKSKDSQSKYRDYYFWRKGLHNGQKPPNNWSGFFGPPAWEKDNESGDYYLHLFSKKQPDLNFYNPDVIEEIKSIMRFWLDKGIGGFRCDVINIIFKNSLDNGKKRLFLTGIEHYLSTDGCHNILKQLHKEVLSQYDCFTVGETVFVTTKTANDLCGSDRKELDMVFPFEHMESDQIMVKWFSCKFRPKRLIKTIVKWQNELEWNANYLENHDQPRSVSRFVHEGKFAEVSAKMLATLLLTLKGTPYIFQGQEIGMTNYPFTNIEEINDVESQNINCLAKKMGIPQKLRFKMIQRKSRAHARTPMQWNHSSYAGFSSVAPWIMVNPNYQTINVESQLPLESSLVNYYKKLIHLRKTDDILIYGSFKAVKLNNDLFIFEREYKGKKDTILLNFSKNYIPLKNIIQGRVLLSNYNKTKIEDTLQPFESAIVRSI
ncbi:MAG: alpha-glucosidase [Oscillospiraceae bacterium]